MLFKVTFHAPGDPDRQVTISDESVVGAVGGLLNKASELVQPAVLRGVLRHAEPFLPAIAEAAGAGLVGQVGVQVGAALARRAFDGNGQQPADDTTDAERTASDEDQSAPTNVIPLGRSTAWEESDDDVDDADEVRQAA